MAETQQEETLKSLVGTYYKTSMANATLAMSKQPAVVDARSQTDFILQRTDSLIEMGYIKNKPGRDAIDWTLLEQVIAENQDLYAQAQVQVGVMATLARRRAPAAPCRPAERARRPPRVCRRRGAASTLCSVWWTLLSIGMFAGIWELCWALGWPIPSCCRRRTSSSATSPSRPSSSTPRRAGRSASTDEARRPYEAVMITIGATTMRVLVGLVIASVLADPHRRADPLFPHVRRLMLPTITLLSPVSPIAWLPVAIFLFGIGNAPAIFMVVVALFFHMVLATISQIDGVNRNLINVARTMGATKRQIYTPRDHPGDPARAAGGAAA